MIDSISIAVVVLETIAMASYVTAIYLCIKRMKRDVLAWKIITGILIPAMIFGAAASSMDILGKMNISPEVTGGLKEIFVTLFGFSWFSVSYVIIMLTTYYTLLKL